MTSEMSITHFNIFFMEIKMLLRYNGAVDLNEG